MKVAELLTLLHRHGWVLVATRGSHRQFKHPERPGRVTVAGKPSTESRGNTMRYAVVIEQAEGNFSAYVPDLPGCVAAASSLEEVEQAIREAIEFHVEGLVEDGLPIPAARSVVEYIEVAA